MTFLIEGISTQLLLYHTIGAKAPQSASHSCATSWVSLVPLMPRDSCSPHSWLPAHGTRPMVGITKSLHRNRAHREQKHRRQRHKLEGYEYNFWTFFPASNFFSAIIVFACNYATVTPSESHSRLHSRFPFYACSLNFHIWMSFFRRAQSN